MFWLRRSFEAGRVLSIGFSKYRETFPIYLTARIAGDEDPNKTGLEARKREVRE
jgi:hypothetical protein